MDNADKILQELQRINSRFDQMEESVSTKISDAKSDIMRSAAALVDLTVKPKFDLLAEGQKDILDKLVPRSRVDDLEEEVKFLKSYIRRMNEDIQELKKAQ